MDIWTLDSYTKVFKQATKPEPFDHTINLHSAINEYESAQIVLRNTDDFELLDVLFTDLKNKNNVLLKEHIRYNYQDYIYFNDGVFYPDPLSNKKTIPVSKEEAQSVWITTFVPKGTIEGEYCGTITIRTNQGNFEVEMRLNVYPVEIPDVSNSEFNLEYWTFFVGNWYHGYDSFNVIERQYGYKKYSNDWWQLIEQAADNMKENRINTILVRAHDLLLDAGTRMDDLGVYSFNWTLFDQYIECFMNKGIVKQLTGFQLMEQCYLNFVHVIGCNDQGEMSIISAALDSEVANNWLNQYLPALKSHLEDKGWLSLWIQHIADEPNYNSDRYIKLREMVREHLPNVRCSEPLDVMKFNDDFTGKIDLWIPRIEHFDDFQGFFKDRQVKGEEVWVYSCCMPNNDCFLNKFIDRPLFHNRLLSWGCFKHGITGFLHWGYNYWNDQDVNFGLTPSAYFKGDGFIVYPDSEHHSIKNSARMISTRDGIEDYELFTILSRKDPNKAWEIVTSVFTNFSYFTSNIDRIKEMRKQLLWACSKEND